MIVKKYKCKYCLNETFGPEINLQEEDAYCLVCGRKGTLEMDSRDWNVELREVPKRGSGGSG